MARLIPSRQNFVCGGPHKGRGGTEWPTENRTRAELKGLPSPQARKREERSTAQRARRTLMSVEN